jgi:molybdopterin converting factor small subunit
VTTVRLFAAAAEAVGAREHELEVTTVRALIDQQTHDARSGYVLSHCSFLANGERIADFDADVSGVELIDVLPPVAGG